MQRVPSSLRDRAVFVDTSAFFGDLDRHDQWHEEAARGFRQLAQERRTLYTTNLVVAEVYALALARVGAQVGRRWLQSLSSIPIVYQQPHHHASVLEILDRHPEAGFSYADAFSFVVMEELGLRLAFSFDRHFRGHGWTVFPPFL